MDFDEGISFVGMDLNRKNNPVVTITIADQDRYGFLKKGLLAGAKGGCN